MKRFVSRFLPALPIAALLIGSMFSHSCANTAERPTGGLKDTLPPVLISVYPQPKATNVPLEGMEFLFRFDEYITIKEAGNIYLSPPLQKRAKTKIKGKSLLVSFEEPFEPNTTYTLSLNGAIADNNEGNMFPGYTFQFSTGDYVDSLYLTGIVQDNETLTPVKNATVCIYKASAPDSAIYLNRPYASAKSDDWGFFRIRNIADTLYRLYAIMDENNNNLYDPDNEKIAFVDSLIRPVNVIDEKAPELRNYDMKDTLKCLARKTEYELNLFREKPTKQYIRFKGRVDDRKSFVSFMAPNAHIDTLWIRGVKADRLITQMNLQRDSLEIWVNDRRQMPDTFHLYVNYMKPDSLGLLAPFTESLHLVNPKPHGGRKKYVSKKNIKHEDTICVMKLTADPKRMERDGFVFEFAQPLVSEEFASVKFTSINPRQLEESVKFDVERDSLNLRRYVMRMKGNFQQGYQYKIKVPMNAFHDITGFGNDSSEVSVKLPTDDKLSNLALNLKGVGNKYIVDLLDQSKSKSIYSYIVDRDTTINFKYLDANTYYIRFTEDKNNNSIVDAGNVLMGIAPERVRFFKLSDGKPEYKIIAGSELSQDIDVDVLFK